MGAFAAAIGFFFLLVGLGQIPSRPNSPLWVVLVVGVCFLFGGLAVMLPAIVTGEVSSDGSLPSGAPSWLRVLQLLFVLTILACLATIGSFVAFGPGTRSFNISLPFFSSSGGSEIVGRVAFGFGAIIAWLCLIAAAVSGWRKLTSHNKP
jgi:DMSO reductase anchor subunit